MAMEFSPSRSGGGYKLSGGGTTAADLVRTSKLASTVLKRATRTSSEWSPRFVVLQPSVSLCYFESESDPVEKAKGVILLSQDAVMDVASDGEGGRPIVVVRPTPSDPDARTLFFRVGSLSEAREWQAALSACKLSSLVGERGEVERRLEVSRAETAALHGSLLAYKEALLEREEEMEALGLRLEREVERREALGEAIAREREGQVERDAAESEALQAYTQCLGQACAVLATATATALDFVEKCKIAGVPLAPPPAAAAVGGAPPFHAAPHPPHHSTFPPAPLALVSLSEVDPHFKSLVGALDTLKVTLGEAMEVSERQRVAYRALRAKALEVGRIVGRLGAAKAAKCEEEKARESAWLAKERQWAVVVQALSARLSREKDRCGQLGEVVRSRGEEIGALNATLAAKTKALEARAAKAGAGAGASAGAAAVGGDVSVVVPFTPTPSSSSRSSGGGGARGGGGSGDGGWEHHQQQQQQQQQGGGLVSPPPHHTQPLPLPHPPHTPSTSTSSVLGEMVGWFIPEARSRSNSSSAGASSSSTTTTTTTTTTLAGLPPRSRTSSREDTTPMHLMGSRGSGGGGASTPNVAAAAAAFAAGFVTPKKPEGWAGGVGVEGGGLPLPTAADAASTHTGSGGVVGGGLGGGGGGGAARTARSDTSVETSDLEKALNALQSVYENGEGGGIDSASNVSASGTSSSTAAAAVSTPSKRVEREEEEHNPFASSADNEGGEEEEEYNPFGPAPPASALKPKVKAPVVTSSTSTPTHPPPLPSSSLSKPVTTPAQPMQGGVARSTSILSSPPPQHLQQQHSVVAAAPRVAPPAAAASHPHGKQRAGDPPPPPSSSSSSSISPQGFTFSIAHPVGGENEQLSTLKKLGAGALAGVTGVGAKAAGVLGGLLKRGVGSALAATTAIASTSSAAAHGGSGGLPPTLTAFGGGSGGGSVLVSDPFPGRLYLMVMGVRSLPESAFLKAPIRSGVQVKAGGLFQHNTTPSSSHSLLDFRASPIMPVVEVGRTKTLCAAVNSVFPLKVTSSMSTARLCLDVWNAGLVRSGYSVGTVVLDTAFLGEDPGQPYAAWVPLIPRHQQHQQHQHQHQHQQLHRLGGAGASGLGGVEGGGVGDEEGSSTSTGLGFWGHHPLTPLTQCAPVVSSVQWMNPATSIAALEDSLGGGEGGGAGAAAASAGSAGAGSGGGAASAGPSGHVEAPIMHPIPAAIASAEAARHGSTLLPLAAIHPPEDSTIPCALIQLCYCLRPDDKPRFAMLSHANHSAPPHPGGGGGASAGAAPLTSITTVTASGEYHAAAPSPLSLGAKRGMSREQQQQQQQLEYESQLHQHQYDNPSSSAAMALASTKLTKQVTILRRAFKGLCAEKEKHEEASQSWAAEREVLLAQIQQLKAAVAGGGVEKVGGEEAQRQVQVKEQLELPFPAGPVVEGGEEKEGGEGEDERRDGAQEVKVGEEAVHHLPFPLPPSLPAPTPLLSPPSLPPPPPLPAPISSPQPLQQQDADHAVLSAAFQAPSVVVDDDEI